MILPSTHRGFADKEPRPIEWQLVFHYLTDPNSSVMRNTVLSRDARRRGDKKLADRLKHSCGAFAPAVQMRGGHDGSQIMALTQCCISDTDHIAPEQMEDVRRRAVSDPHTMLEYVTNSACGLRNIYRWEAVDTNGERIPESFFTWDGREKQSVWLERVRPYHDAAFRLGNEYYSRLLGYEWDAQTSDPNRLSFYCHDPRAYLNMDAVPFVITPDMVRAFRSAQKNRPPVTTAQKNRPSVTSPVVGPFSQAESWVSKRVAYAPGTYNRYVMLCVYRLAEMGVSENLAAAWATERFYDYAPKALRAIVRSCYRRAQH